MTAAAPGKLVSYRKIAAELGVSEATVRRDEEKALAKIAAALEAELEREARQLETYLLRRKLWTLCLAATMAARPGASLRSCGRCSGCRQELRLGIGEHRP